MIRIGCSGWQYPGWRGRFYPAELPLTKLFTHYARVFDTVELNSTFYRLPSVAAVERWRQAAPPGFLFAFKASRFLTHMKKLLAPQEPIERLFGTLDHLGSSQGPALYQLPETLRRDDHRLSEFLARLPRRRRHAIEFRHASWYEDSVFSLLNRHQVALCWHDIVPEPPRIPTAPFLYLRFHGRGLRYGGRYGRASLSTHVKWLRPYLREHDVFAFFNNDRDGHAPFDALLLRELLQRG